MQISSIFKISLAALRAHKVRTGLAVLGVTIGMASIIVVYSAGEGVKGLVVDQVESFGSDIIEVEIKIPTSKKGYASEQQSAMNLLQGGQVTTLKLDDMKDIMKLSNVQSGYALLMGQESASYANETRRTTILATSPSFIEIDKSEIASGRFFSETEDSSLAQVVVLGYKIKERLFGSGDPIGKLIQIRQSKFKVIGVMAERGSIMTMSFDDFVYLPVKTMQKKVMGVDFLHDLIFKVKDMSLVENTAEQMRVILRENHDIPAPQEAQEGWADTGKDDFRVTSMKEMLDIWGKMTNTLTILLLVIVGVSLIVGGVGVMNVMYIIVNERVPEIGLRKAVGATRIDILGQFLAESVLITLAGGIAGVVLGIMISYLISWGADYSGITWHFVVPARAYLTAIGFSLVFGIFFGLYPAQKAARLDPVVALRTGK